MKKTIVLSLLLSVFSLAFSTLVSLADPLDPEDGQARQTPHTGDSEPSPGVRNDAEYVYDDDAITVRVLVGEAVTTMTMSDYLIGVVAAEMPAVFDEEALKAQAVAARTETLYHMRHESAAHPGADVCDDYTCCQAYRDDGALREKWGGDYGAHIQKITDAVRHTDGECLVYQDEPIQAVFHSSSAGKTADSGEVWGTSLPYLVSVTSPETAAQVPNYVSTVTVSLADFKETVLKHYPDAVFPKDRSRWITDITYTGSGRIDSLKLGGVTVTGPVLRSMFGLRSTAAAIEIDSKNVTFTTTGYGHGVGMSQYGANTLALEGYDYKEILLWYYTGVSFGSAADFVQ
jgi:stage II sporulation protein D